jgi:hypothetical protein
VRRVAAPGRSHEPAQRSRMLMKSFVDDDAGYVSWAAAVNPDGYVLNTHRTPSSPLPDASPRPVQHDHPDFLPPARAGPRTRSRSAVAGRRQAACRGWADRIYGVFLTKHRRGNPGGTRVVQAARRRVLQPDQAGQLLSPWMLFKAQSCAVAQHVKRRVVPARSSIRGSGR